MEIYDSRYGSKYQLKMDMDLKIQITKVVIYQFGQIFTQLIILDFMKKLLQDTSGRFYKLNSGIYLDTVIYKKRIRILAELFLKEANYRAGKINKKAFCYVVGLGLGAWQLSGAGDVQKIITIKTYLELLSTGNFHNVSDLYFGWFNLPNSLAIESFPSNIGGIQIHIGYRNPAEPLK